MLNTPRTTASTARWAFVLYGLALGLLLAALQVARYRWLLLEQAQEWYVGLIALLFTVVGIWAGHRWRSGRSNPAQTPVALAPTKVETLSGAHLEQALQGLGLTGREYEVLQLIAGGLSNQEIAGRLFVSLNTVKTHTSNLFAKLEVQRRTQAVQKAQALGLLPTAHPKV